MATIDACLSLINSKVTEQRARGVALLERGEFQPPDSVKVLPSPRHSQHSKTAFLRTHSPPHRSTSTRCLRL